MSEIPAMSSGLSVGGCVARGERDREHHRAGRNEAPPATRIHLRLAERRMAEAEEVAGLVRGDRLQVVTARLAAGRYGPGERRVEEDVGLEDLAAARVDD